MARQRRKAAAISDIELWTSDDCARAWGVRTPTWLGYVSRGHAPKPVAEPDESGRRRWIADEVRRFPRPGAGRSRAGTTPRAAELIAQMERAAERMEELRAEQRALLAAGKQEGLEILSMARALGISRQTAYSWLDRS